MRKCLLPLLLLLAAGSCFAQAGYVVMAEDSLTAAASVVTIQPPSSDAARTVRFVGAYVYCSVQCDVTLERDGSAATTTSMTVVGLNSSVPASKTLAFRSSNVGAGMALGKYTVPAGGTQVIDLGQLVLHGSGGNVTLRTNSITGTARVAIQFSEDR